MDQPVTEEEKMTKENITPIDADVDPLDGVPDLLAAPSDEDEQARRRHIMTFAQIAANRNETREARQNAIRHMLICDPARGIGALIELVEWFAALHTLTHPFVD
jgi:hypothetical protein